jgi:hypothetical protein
VDYFGRKQWKAHYGVEPGSLIGGPCVAHQYTSTPIDKNVMLDSEIVTAQPDELPTDEPTADEFRQAMSYLRHDVLGPLSSYKYPKIKAAMAEADRVFDQYGAA